MGFFQGMSNSTRTIYFGFLFLKLEKISLSEYVEISSIKNLKLLSCTFVCLKTCVRFRKFAMLQEILERTV